MPSFEVSFEVFCRCGEGLCSQSTGRNSRIRGEPQVEVEPCAKCLEAVVDKAYQEGYKKGLEEAEHAAD